MSKNSYTHIVKYTGLLGGVQGINILIALVRNKLVAVILGPMGVGLISLFNSAINLLSSATNLGIATSAVKSISEAQERGDSESVAQMVKLIRSWSLLTALLGILVCVLAAPVLAPLMLGDDGRAWQMVLLSLIVAFMAITGGEISILKGTRRLRRLATISILNVVAALFISVPIYYFFRLEGIIASLIIMALAQMLITIGYSYTVYPLRLSFQRSFLSLGRPIVKLGVAFVMAGILGSGAEFLIRTFLNREASLEMIGLYSTAYMLMMTYASVVFSAMDSDYYPRLSAVNNNVKACNLVINRQIEVAFLIASPLLVLFLISLPVVLPLLYSSQFLAAISMTQIFVFAIYLRAVKLPIAYLPLAKGDSLSYLLLEAVYDVLYVVGVIIGFRLAGLKGAGVALTMIGFIDWMIHLFYTHHKYGYRSDPTIFRYMALQLPFGFLAYALTFTSNPWIYWPLGLLLIALSTFVSLYLLRNKLPVIGRLWKKLERRNNS